MSNYRITITNYNDPSDTGEILFSQNQMNSFLDAGAPYNETEIIKYTEDKNLIPIVSIDVEADKDIFQWHNKYYGKETFCLIVLDAVKKNALALVENSSIVSEDSRDWKIEREESVAEVIKAYENRKYE